MNIRKYQHADKEQCLEIFHKNVGQFFTLDELPFFDLWLENSDNYPYFVVEMDGHVVACGGIYYDERFAMAGLSWGMVDPEYQRQGIGRKLTEFRIKQICKAFPGTPCFIQTTKHAAGFYTKLGFTLKEVKRNRSTEGQDWYFLEYPAA